MKTKSGHIDPRGKSQYVQILKKSKSPYIGMSILLFGFIFTIALAVILHQLNKGTISDLRITLVAFILTIGISIAIYKLSVRKIDCDISTLSFRKEPIKIKEIIEKDDVEAGSGVLYIPVLGDVFPKFWGQKMKQIKRYYLISTDDKSHEITHGDYVKLTKHQSCYLVYGTHSNIRVGIELDK